MWVGFFCRQDVSITIFGRTKEFSEVRGTSLMCNFGVRSRFSDVIYGVRPPNGSPGCTYLIGPLMSKGDIYMSFYTIILHWQLVGRRKKLFSGSPYLFEVSRSHMQPQYLINCKPVYKFKDGAQTSLRKALFQNINKFALLAISVKKKTQ